MRGSLVIIAALCVIAAAEASSVRFVSVDEGQNDKDKAHRSEVSEGTDQVIQKKVEDVVKKINDGEEQLEKTVKSLDVERSSTGGKTSESAGEGVKKAASSEKSKVRKRDVRRLLENMSKRGMKRAHAEGANIFNTRKIIIKYLSIQKTVINKITKSLIFAVGRLENDQKEKDALITALNTLQKDVEQAYDNTISTLGSQSETWDIYSGGRGKFMRADDIPALMTAMNQRNPLALIPVLLNTIAGAASIATSFRNSVPQVPDIESLIEITRTLLSTGNLPPISDFM